MTREQFKLGDRLLISAAGDWGYLWECTVAQIEDIGVKLVTPGNPNGEWYRWESMDLANWTLAKVLSIGNATRKWSGEYERGLDGEVLSLNTPWDAIPDGVVTRIKWEAEEIL